MKPVDPPDPPTMRYPERHEEGTQPQVSGAIISDDPTMASGAYAIGGVLGRGGMGEVLLALDRKIGREVALKRLRSGAPTEDEVGRFLREARIQARLDHPAIVPVYELGRDHAGRPYFTMKRLSGAPLAALLARGEATRERLLRAFVDVCRAIDFAHARGVVHRDLKPANIVLGEFGEVYVIDWGLARVIGDVDGIAAADVDTIEGAAPPGQVVGTPGYMAPEQLEEPEVDRAADIYALGAILFEILAREPLHPRGPGAAASTLGELVPISPAARRPDRQIAPELDELCVAMLARTPDRRPSARRCAERIELYLDGDRDLARRRTMAIDLVWRARAALEQERRAEAMQAASRALALDPQAQGAAEIVTTLMLEPPREAPAELRAMLHQADLDDVSRHARAAIPGYLMIAAFLPIVIGNGVLRWPAVLAGFVAALALAVAARQLMRFPARSFAWMTLYAIGNAAVLVLLARVTNPFLVVPAVVSFITASVITYPAFLERPVVLMLVMLGGLLLPIGLPLAGVLPITWHLRDGGIFLAPDAMSLGGTAALVTVILASVATVLMAGIQSTVLGRAKREAQHKLVTQAWHLRQLLPRAPAPLA